jgi:uncharacterized protein
VKSLENAISWFEIPVMEIGRARKFYEGVFSINMQPLTVGNGLKMALFPVTAGTVGGALCEHAAFYKPSHDGTLVYLNANPDLREVLDRVEDNGGRIIIGKTQISPEYGYMAVFEDTEGNRVALRSMK